MLARADSGLRGLRGVDPGAYAAGLYDVASSRLTCWHAPIQGSRGLGGLDPSA